MYNYVDNIIGDVKSLIEEEEFPSSRAALNEMVARVTRAKAVEPRIWELDARNFVQWALNGDDELQNYAKELDGDVFKDAVVYNHWCCLDAQLYCLVCKVKEKEILKKGISKERK